MVDVRGVAIRKMWGRCFGNVIRVCRFGKVLKGTRARQSSRMETWELQQRHSGLLACLKDTARHTSLAFSGASTGRNVILEMRKSEKFTMKLHHP